MAKWTTILRNPQAWSRAASTRSDLQQESKNDLAKLGIADEDLKTIANAGLVEVKIACLPNTLNESAHLPWEFLLRSATNKFRSQPLLIVRHLVCRTPTPSAAIPERLIVVKSSPGFLSELYTEFSLRIEQANVEGNLHLTSRPDLWNPTVDEVASAIVAQSPNVIHLAGVDILQARELGESGECTVEELNSLRSDQNDGMVFKGKDSLPVAVSPEVLAEKLCSSSEVSPSLVAFNFNNSASLAAAAVSRGSQAALGCQGEMDDELAEIFFCNFYLAWNLGKWRVLDAYRLATAELREEGRTDPIRAQQLRGSDIVLWSGQSLIDHEQRERLRKRSKSLILPPEELREEFDSRRMKPAAYDANTSPVSVHARPRKEVNYSLLHNNRSLFHSFYIRKIPPLGQVQNISVEVVLLAGDEQFRYKARKDLKYTLWMLDEEVRVPLTSKFARTVRESMYTSLLVKVAIADQTIFEKTFRVTLLPIDQWQDDDQNRKWLPSFVLPRDPAVSHIVESAQSYLLALADDSAAGFDGYQSVADEGVDSQARALWYALSYQHSISYVNPPPTFTNDAQRLRTPSDVFDGGRGTCIDLALMLASCMEYIDIYTVVFLLDGHAFPGYYRTEGTHQEVREWMTRNAGSQEEDAWMLGRDFYGTLLAIVKRGDLIPLETTLLTKHRGFWEAVDEGIFNLSSGKDFQYMIDVKLARENGVTPLPIWNKGV